MPDRFSKSIYPFHARFHLSFRIDIYSVRMVKLSRVLISIVVIAALRLVLPHLAALGQTQSSGGHNSSRVEASEIPPTANKYTVVFFGKPIGIEGVWKTGRDIWNYHFEFNDRGHGPWIEETITVDTHGAPVSLKLNGHDELEKAASDDFRISGRKSIWKNNIEHGESVEPGFYLSAPVVHEQVSAVPEEVALLARALLRAPDRKLRILPQGEVSITRGAELNLESHGKQKKVIRYEIGGLDFQPTTVWLEDDGTTFAIPSGEFTLVRQGWENSLTALDEADDSAHRAREAEMALRLAHRPASSFAYRHVNLFDSETARVQPNMTV